MAPTVPEHADGPGTLIAPRLNRLPNLRGHPPRFNSSVIRTGFPPPIINVWKM